MNEELAGVGADHSAVAEHADAPRLVVRDEAAHAIAEQIGDDVVRELRFVQARLSRRERPKLRTVPRATRKSIELPELKDPELRKAFERLIEAWGRSSR